MATNKVEAGGAPAKPVDEDAVPQVAPLMKSLGATDPPGRMAACQRRKAGRLGEQFPNSFHVLSCRGWIGELVAVGIGNRVCVTLEVVAPRIRGAAGA